MSKNNKNRFVAVSPSIFMSADTGNVYEFSDTTHSRTNPRTVSKDGKQIVTWGKDNLLPFHNRQILADNDIKQTLINTDVDITVGKGLVLYRELVEDGKRRKEYIEDPELEDWMEEINAAETFRETVQDTKEFGNSWTEFILSRDRSKVASIMSLDAVDCRLGLADPANGRTDSTAVYLADWKTYKQNQVQGVPLLNIHRPVIDGKMVKFALHVKKIVSGMPFYTLAEWHGTRTWAEIANIIPIFHKQGLKNGYMLRYHIKIPLSYFNGKQDKELEKAKIDVQTMLDNVLSGAADAHKAFFSFINDSVPNPAEWSIEKIETDLKDDSYIKLHETASKVHARGHNLHPVIAGIETSGSLSSGSEILNLLNYHVSYKTQRIRNIALKSVVLAKNYNFPDRRDIKIGVEDVELTTLDQNPKGQQTVVG
jgi:hypothetical protein